MMGVTSPNNITAHAWRRWHFSGPTRKGAKCSISPCSDIKIVRTLQRLGVDDLTQFTAVMESNDICDEVCMMFNEKFELSRCLDILDCLARCYQDFRDDQVEKFCAVFSYAWPQTPDAVVHLAESLQDFTVINGIGTAEDYGKLIAEGMGIKPCLLEFLDYDRLGQRRIDGEGGEFVDQGYIAYKGARPEIEEVLARHIPPIQDMQEKSSMC